MRLGSKQRRLGLGYPQGASDELESAATLISPEAQSKKVDNSGILEVARPSESRGGPVKGEKRTRKCLQIYELSWLACRTRHPPKKKLVFKRKKVRGRFKGRVE